MNEKNCSKQKVTYLPQVLQNLVFLNKTRMCGKCSGRFAWIGFRLQTVNKLLLPTTLFRGLPLILYRYCCFGVKEIFKLPEKYNIHRAKGS